MAAGVQEVARHERSMGRDYRLNWRLHKHCDSDAQKLCADVCDGEHHACGGRVLRCLMDKKSDIQREACRSEVFYFVRMDVRPPLRCATHRVQPCGVPSEAHCLRDQ